MEFRFEPPSSDRVTFEKALETANREFTKNRACTKLDSGTFTMADYHSLLCNLFYQVYNSSGSFAQAAASLPPRMEVARSYLLHHADDEKTHWTWILNDLENTGFKGVSPLKQLPSPKALAYTALNYYLSMNYPISRLAVALMLESIGAAFGSKYAQIFVRSLGLKNSQATFFFGHGDTDVGHVKEIWSVIDKCELAPTDWAWMVTAVQTSAELYQTLYNL